MRPPDKSRRYPPPSADRCPGRGWQPDYVFYRPNGKPLRHLGFRMELNNPETALSDHNLLLVDFEQS